MKLSVKTLKGKVFEIEADLEEKVEAVKRKIEAANAEFPANMQKLIYSGKILEDASCVKDYSIKEGEFVVVMVTKAKPPAAESAAAAATPAPAPAAASAPAPAPAATAPAEGPAPMEAAAARAGVSEASINQLCDMGFPRPEVERCLQAAFGNPDRAVEYLMNGIPEAAAEGGAAAPGGGAPQGGAAGGGGGGGGGDGMAFPAMPPGGGGEASGPLAALQELRNHPRFEELAAMVLENPEMLEQILQSLSTTHPHIAQEIAENPEEFLHMLQDSVGESGDEDDTMGGMLGGEGGEMQIDLSEAEQAAVERLASLGFERDLALEAYLACGKNEELAANYLFEEMDLSGG